MWEDFHIGLYTNPKALELYSYYFFKCGCSVCFIFCSIFLHSKISTSTPAGRIHQNAISNSLEGGGRLYNLPAKVGFFKECHGLGVSACMNPLTIMNQPFFPSKFKLNILEKIPVVPRIKTSKILTMIKLSAQKIYQNIKILSKLIILYQKILYFWFGLVENSSNTKW